MSENLGVEESEKPSGGAARLTGVHAIAAAAPTLFAPFAATFLSLNGAPALPVVIAALCAAPLAAVAAAALGGGLRSQLFALATAPIALGALWGAWLTGGGVSPLAPWILAAAAGIGLFGGRMGAPIAAAMALGMAVLLAALPDPSASYEAFRSREERELIALASWGLSAVSIAAGVWAAVASWAEALPPLRHPTILARKALGKLTERSGVCALRIGDDGRIAQAVGAVEATLDLPREDLRGLPIIEILHPDDASATATHLAAARQAARAPRRRGDDPVDGFDPITLRVRTRMGGYRWVEGAFTSAAQFPAPQSAEEASDAAGGADAMLILRERWRPLSDDLAPGDDDRSAFLAQIGSALRDELTEVVGYAEIMKTELFGPLGGERYREYARLAHDSGERLLERVEELLDLASLEAGGGLATDQIADPTPLIDGAVRLVRSQAERAGVIVRADIPADAPHVRIDRRALRRVLVNLLLDAVRRSSIGDQVHLRIGAEDGAIRFATSIEPGESLIGPEAEVGANEAHGVQGAAEAARLAGEARFGRLVAHSFVERLGGALMFHADAANKSAAADEGGPKETLLAEAILPIEPPKALDAEEGRSAPIAAPRARKSKKTAVAASTAAKRGAAAESSSRGGPSVVAPPVYDTTDDEDSGPLSAERQTEMARRFEEDLKRDKGKAATAKTSEADEDGPEDDVDRPLFEPKPESKRA